MGDQVFLLAFLDVRQTIEHERGKKVFDFCVFVLDPLFEQSFVIGAGKYGNRYGVPPKPMPLSILCRKFHTLTLSG